MTKPTRIVGLTWLRFESIRSCGPSWPGASHGTRKVSELFMESLICLSKSHLSISHTSKRMLMTGVSMQLVL